MILDYPVNPPNITQYFGENPEIYSDESKHKGWSYPGHNGVDFSGYIGQSIYAPADGVADVGYEPNGYGMYVKITHPDGTISYLAHLKRATINNRTNVKKGQIVGEMGSSGYSTGVHLHWGYKIPNGGAAGYKGYDDPLKYINKQPNTKQNNTNTPSESNLYIVDTEYLNLRSSPEVTYDNSNLVGQLYSGRIVKKLEEVKDKDNNEWIKIEAYCCVRNSSGVYLKKV